MKKVTTNPFVKFIKSNLGILIAFVLLFIFLSVFSNSFLSSKNLLSVSRQICINMLLALGITMVLIVGGIDLSVGSVVGLVGVVSVMLMNSGVHWFLACLIGLCIGAVVGIINGVIIAYTGMAPFIVTLSTMGALRGVAYTITGGRSIACQDEVFNSIGNGYFLGVPIPVYIVVVALIVISIILYRTKFGRHMYAIGGNPSAAVFSGIKINKETLKVYIISGVLAALAGLILATRLSSGQPSAGNGYESDAISAAVLGGTSFTGGIGTVSGTFFGAMVIGILSNGLNLLHIDSYPQMIIKGVVIIAAVGIDIIKRKRSRN